MIMKERWREVEVGGEREVWVEREGVWLREKVEREVEKERGVWWVEGGWREVGEREKGVEIQVKRGVWWRERGGERAGERERGCRESGVERKVRRERKEWRERGVER